MSLVEEETEENEKKETDTLFAAKELALDDSLAEDMEVFLGQKDKEEWKKSFLEAVKDVIPSGSTVTYTTYSQAVLPQKVILSMSMGDARKNEVEYTALVDADDGVEFRPGGTETQNKPVVLDVSRGHRVWRSKEADKMSELQKRYEELLGDKVIPFYQELKGGELFKAIEEVNYRVYKGEPDEKTSSTSGYGYINWEWEKVSIGDILMFVYQEKDEEGEITPRWIITDSGTGETSGETRIRDLYIASHKLERLQQVGQEGVDGDRQ